MSGNLVWSAPGQYGDASANAKIQRYNDQDYLTFWAGEKLQESGLGRYYMLNSSYDVVHTMSAVGESIKGDLHEFKITGDGSAIITVYERVWVNLKDTNINISADQMTVDGFLQEIDVATGKLIFEWRASDHLDHPALQTSFGGFVADGAFDYFHMNSIEKDTRGNYLISSRHLHTLVYVESITGNILWTLGGDAGDFEDLSQGDATGFRWQHDARWISEDDGIISLFDNGIAHKHPDAAYSQGLIIQLDFVDWSATLLQEYTSRDLIGSPSQGDVQLLRRPHDDDDDHVFIGWGASAAFTEHSISGDLLCETHFGASWLFCFERVSSYRAFKTFDWKAIPSVWDPEARIAGNRLHVSCNGATEVVHWTLQGRSTDANTTGDPWGLQDSYEETVPRSNDFEQFFTLPSPVESVTYRIAASDARRNVLRYSNDITHERSSLNVWFGAAYIFGVFLMVLCCLLRSWRSILRHIWVYRNKYEEDSGYHELQYWEPA